MVRWLVMNGALITSGSAADMKFMICRYKKEHGRYPQTIVFDIPRSKEKYLSYTGIEEISNGVFASTKYECEPVVMPYPRIFVFANFCPNLDQLQNDDISVDRFIVHNVDYKEGEEYGSMDKFLQK